MNSNLSFLPAGVRTAVYGVAVVCGILSGAATKGFSAIGQAQPTWLAFLNGALPDVLVAAGAVAVSHVTVKTTDSLSTVLPVLAGPATDDSENDEDDDLGPDGDPDDSEPEDEPQSEVATGTPAPETVNDTDVQPEVGFVSGHKDEDGQRADDVASEAKPVSDPSSAFTRS